MSSDFIFRNAGNIIHADQHTDLEEGVFLARMEWDLDGFKIPREQIASQFQPLALEFGMSFQLFLSNQIQKVAIFASRLPHCLYDLLLRHRAGEFKAQIELIISNHAETGVIARDFGIDFRCFPVTAANKLEMEAAEIREVQARGIDLVILARYMQVLSDRFVSSFPHRIINIHHSFLPAFVGARPYHQAFRRGVKLIGATGHYVTSDLDNGPIIEQEIARVSHRDSVEDIIRKGRDLEKVVLARAVRLHLSHRILTYGARTVIFD